MSVSCHQLYLHQRQASHWMMKVSVGSHSTSATSAMEYTHPSRPLHHGNEVNPQHMPLLYYIRFNAKQRLFLPPQAKFSLMKIAKAFILRLHAGYHILAYELLISGCVGKIRGPSVGVTECTAVGISPQWFKGLRSLASACFIAPFMLIIQQRCHYSIYLVVATDRPTVHKVKLRRKWWRGRKACDKASQC